MPKNQQNSAYSQNHILPGRKPVLELLAENPGRVAKIFCRKSRDTDNTRLTRLCQANDIAMEYVDNHFLDSLCHMDQRDTPIAHQGYVAILKPTELTSLGNLLDSASHAKFPLVLALDQIQDPGNLGTLCRTAYGLGFPGILLPKHNNAALGPAAWRASAGALDKLPIVIATNLARALDQAEEAGFTIYGAARAPEFGKECGRYVESGSCVENAFKLNWTIPAVLVLGNENRGIRPGVAKRCSIFVSIPFERAFDSLNIAQAGAILIGLFAAQLSG